MLTQSIACSFYSYFLPQLFRFYLFIPIIVWLAFGILFNPASWK